MTSQTSEAAAVVCVTGMHRSGTSLAARALEFLGVSLGTHDGLLRAGPDNPAGYWENEAIKELDDVLLASLGGSWDEPPVLPSGWECSPDLDVLRARARDALRTAFGNPASGELVGFKDPRLSLLLPFWRTVTPISGTIVVVRDPVEVSASLAARNGMRPSQAAVLWLRYLLAAVANDPNHLIVTQPSFFAALPETLSAMSRHLGLPSPGPGVADQVRAHLDPSLNHHRSTDSPDPGATPLAALASLVWNDGDVDVDRIPPDVAPLIAQGWLRGVGDVDLLAESRAQVVALTEEIRQRNRVRDAQLSTRVRRRVRAARRWAEAKAPW